MTSAMENSGQTVEMLIGVRVTDGRAEVTTSASETVSRRHRPITRDEARELTERIRITLARTWELLVTAYTDRAWSALGYKTWDAYCSAEFGETRIPIPKEDREVTVTSLRAAGLSYRSIESATDMSERAARRLGQGSGAANAAPEFVLGADGKKYRASRPTPAIEAAVEPLPDVVEGWVDSDDDLIPCDDCGDSHAPEVSVCPYLLSASSGPVFEDPDHSYGPGAGSAESLVAEERDEYSDEFDAMVAADFGAGQPADAAATGAPPTGGAASGLAQLRVVALAIERLRVAREDLEELPSLASDVGNSLALLELDPDVVIPDQGLAVMIRDAAAGIRAQINSLSGTLDVWVALAERMDATLY